MKDIPLIYKEDKTQEEYYKINEYLDALFGAQNYALNFGCLHIKTINIEENDKEITPVETWKLIHEFKHNKLLNEPVAIKFLTNDSGE